MVSQTHNRSISSSAAGRLNPGAPKQTWRGCVNDSPEQPLPSALQEALLNLYTGEEIRDFWESLRVVLHRALPLEFCGMHFRPWATLPSIPFRERAPFTTEQEFQEFCKLSPFNWPAGNHSHAQLARLSDVIESPQL